MSSTAPRNSRTTHLMASIAVAMLAWHARGAAPDLPRDSAKDAKSDPNTITIEARRERKLLERQLDAFVGSIIVHPWNESLARWHASVCPLVAGLPRASGEFILSRLSQIAASAHVPLGPEHCRANLYVVVTREPGLLLKKWRARDPQLLNDHNGEGGIRRFFDTLRPVRVWYNVAPSSTDGVPVSADNALLGTTSDIPTNKITAASRLVWYATQSLASVIVLVDSNRLQQLRMGQLADYIAMVGLAEVRLDSDLGSTPTILRLFDKGGESVPQSLSDWDQAFLESLYGTEQKSMMQVSEIETSMLKILAP
jgi:hypothetical protein